MAKAAEGKVHVYVDKGTETVTMKSIYAGLVTGGIPSIINTVVTHSRVASVLQPSPCLNEISTVSREPASAFPVHFLPPVVVTNLQFNSGTSSSDAHSISDYDPSSTSSGGTHSVTDMVYTDIEESDEDWKGVDFEMDEDHDEE